MRVVQGGCGARLLHEALDAGWVARQIGRQDLDGEVAAERGVAGPIHLTHSARANPGDDLVPADP